MVREGDGDNRMRMDRDINAKRAAERAVIAAAREVVKAHLSGIYPPVDVLMGRIEEYDAANAPTSNG